ncbi:PUS7 [Symbiodinium necroappetens]|uniref:PUS7 protein n=1 Tax=Symbiodinium necroappetens TaxID=1628268 RepID=A0A812KN67_9DINO|nr:PUS7 [Symbiodinium necroappetens]
MLIPTPPREDEVGISEYLSPDVPGFSGIFKSLWQDFHVHEVDPHGVELHLSELISPGAVAAELKKAAEERREARSALGPDFAFEASAANELREALGQRILEQLLGFLKKQQSQQTEMGQGPAAASKEGSPAVSADEKAVVAEPPGYVDLSTEEISDGSKEARKKAHQVVLKHFSSFLNTETVEADGSRCIRVWMREAERKAKAPTAASPSPQSSGKGAKKGKGKAGKGRGKNKGKSGKSEGPPSETVPSAFGAMRREGWPKDRPDYLYFRLYKENCDTGEAVSSIARCVGRSAKQFTFAGTKDRRAITVQQICAHRLPMDQLRRSVLHRLWDKRVRISDMEYRRDRLRKSFQSGPAQGLLERLVAQRFALTCFAQVAMQSLVSAAASALLEAFRDAKSLQAELCQRHKEADPECFLNYFGLQRFGTRQVRTHKVGAAIISADWQKAIRLILGEVDAKPCAGNSEGHKRSSEEVLGPSKKQRCRLEAEDEGMPAAGSSKVLAIARVYSTHAPPRPTVKVQATEEEEGASQTQEDNEGEKERGRKGDGKNGKGLGSTAAFSGTGLSEYCKGPLKLRQHLERCLLGALARGLSDADTLSQLPHQAVSLYAHAAQSLLWNAVLSRRIREFGREPRIGDLIMVASAAGQAGCTGLPDELDDANEALFEELGEQKCGTCGSSRPSPSPWPLAAGMAAKPTVHAVSFGDPPDPTKITTYPGVARRYLPHEALVIYREKIYAERKAYQTPSGDRWFKEHRRKQREMEKVEKQIKDFRESRREFVRSLSLPSISAREQ